MADPTKCPLQILSSTTRCDTPGRGRVPIDSDSLPDSSWTPEQVWICCFVDLTQGSVSLQAPPKPSPMARDPHVALSDPQALPVCKIPVLSVAGKSSGGEHHSSSGIGAAPLLGRHFSEPHAPSWVAAVFSLLHNLIFIPLV